MKSIGKYEIFEELGRGGFATVYKARDTALDRIVALKVLHAYWAAEQDFVLRFHNEARAAANLRHPSIVTVYEAGEAAGQLFIAMEYLPGRTLRDWLEVEGPLSLEQALPILEQVADALDYAHTQGVVHRDVKPANIMVETTARGPRAVLTDFGLVKAMEGSSALTSQGTLLGSPEYMAPEQADPERVAEIGPATDRYALGIVTYQMLTGRVPFPGNTPATLHAHLNLEPPDPRSFVADLPPDVTDVLLPMLAKAPADRFPTAMAFVERLREIGKPENVRQEPEAAKPSTAQPSLSPSGFSLRELPNWLWWMLGGLFAILVAWAILTGGFPGLNPANRATPTIAPTDTAMPQLTLTPTDTPTAQPTLTPTNTPTPQPTLTPTNTSTPQPTATVEDIPTLTPTLQGLMDRMRIVFHGYVDGQPKSGMAIISPGMISNVVDVTFLKENGVISPDGKYIAFYLFESREIRIAKVDGSETRTVAPVTSKYVVSVRWSPDSKKLSYSALGDSSLHIIQIDTGIDTPLSVKSTLNAGWHSWAPSGDEIVYELGRGGERELYIINMSGDIRQLISRYDFGGCELWAPAWSTGNRIAFTSCEKKLYAVSPDGTDLQQLAESAYSPCWSSDGKWILFLSGLDLMRVTENGESLSVIGTLPYRGGPFSVGPLE